MIVNADDLCCVITGLNPIDLCTSVCNTENPKVNKEVELTREEKDSLEILGFLKQFSHSIKTTAQFHHRAKAE